MNIGVQKSFTSCTLFYKCQKNIEYRICSISFKVFSVLNCIYSVSGNKCVQKNLENFVNFLGFQTVSRNQAKTAYFTYTPSHTENIFHVKYMIILIYYIHMAGVAKFLDRRNKTFKEYIDISTNVHFSSYQNLSININFLLTSFAY